MAHNPSDYVPFENNSKSPRRGTDFKPLYFSSPNPKQYQQRFQQHWRSKKQMKGPRNRYSVGSGSSDQSLNNSFSPHQRPQNHFRNHHKFSNRESIQNDITQYYHHSMVEDPWINLKSYSPDRECNTETSHEPKSESSSTDFNVLNSRTDIDESQSSAEENSS